MRKLVDAGFSVESIEDYKEKERYKNVEELMGLIETVPLVKDFDRIKDREAVETLAKRYWSKKGHPNHLALLHFSSTTILSLHDIF
jgi:hypothetical protein